MLIVTGADSDVARTTDGNISKGFSFRAVITETVKKAEELGYTPFVFDLGNLGIGELFAPRDNVSQRALFKPELIKACMERKDDIVVYIDGDAQLCSSIDEIAEGDYDIGVTVRDTTEVNNEWYRNNFEWVKYVNAGVIFFKPTEATKEFIKVWQKKTYEVGDDQVALNKLACPDDYPEVGSIVTMNGVRVKFFPCKQYNYYYFNDGLVDNIKIMHFKGDVRHFYPFNWRKRLYCKTVVPTMNVVRPLIKGALRR